MDASSIATDLLPLASAADVRGAMRVPGAWTDKTINDVIARAETRLRRYCRWHVWPILRQTHSLASGGGESVLLRSLRVLDIEDVTVGGRAVPVDQIDWSEDGRVRIKGRRFPDALSAVQVTVVHGYDIDEIDDVRDVLMGMLERTLSLPVGVKASSTGDKSVEYAVEASLRPTYGDREVLDEFRIRR